jgi:hypothetical protein
VLILDDERRSKSHQSPQSDVFNSTLQKIQHYLGHNMRLSQLLHRIHASFDRAKRYRDTSLVYWGIVMVFADHLRRRRCFGRPRYELDAAAMGLREFVDYNFKGPRRLSARLGGPVLFDDYDFGRPALPWYESNSKHYSRYISSIANERLFSRSATSTVHMSNQDGLTPAAIKHHCKWSRIRLCVEPWSIYALATWCWQGLQDRRYFLGRVQMCLRLIQRFPLNTTPG